MRYLTCLCLILSLGCGHSIVLKKPDAAARAELNPTWIEKIKAVAQSGDWLVVRGYKGADNLVVATTNIPLSHAVIYDADRGQVIEAIGDGVQVTSLAEFVDTAHRVIVIRPKWWTPERGIAATQFAYGTVGKKYDFLGTVGGGSDERYYCSELCIEAYRAHHTDKEHLPRVMEPGQMYLWGKILYDTGTRH